MNKNNAKRRKEQEKKTKKTEPKDLTVSEYAFLLHSHEMIQRIKKIHIPQ